MNISTDLQTFITKLEAAHDAMYNGNAQPTADLWSHADDAAIFGAFGPIAVGWAKIQQVLPWVASRFKDGKMHYNYEVIYEDGNLAYTAGYEEGDISQDGQSRPLKVRASLIFRKEDGEWRLILRHGDFAFKEESEISRTTAS